MVASSAATADRGPLEPPDTSSPRATLHSFLDSTNEAVRLFERGDPAYVVALEDATRCLDLSELPPGGGGAESTETVVLLKEILDRIEIPPPSAIPDADEAEELDAWTIPHTELTIALIPEGRRAGQWVFTEDTIDRLESFYGKVRALPFQPGKRGALRDEMMRGAGDLIPAWFVGSIPPALHRPVAELPLWKWLVLSVVFALDLFVLALLYFPLRRRRSAEEIPGIGVRLASFLPAIWVAIAADWYWTFADEQLLLVGPSYLLILRATILASYVALAWAVVVGLSWAADVVSMRSGVNPRGIDAQMTQLAFRTLTAGVVFLIVLEASRDLGVPLAALLTGIGVGGIAIALAAQTTIENLIGGLALFVDRPVRVGEVCQFGDRRGTVEEIGLRSTRVRTVDRTLVSIPNAEFAKLQLENVTRRDQILLKNTIRLEYTTSPEQLDRVLEGARKLLDDHAKVAPGSGRVKLTDFTDLGFEIEIFGYVATTDWGDFLDVREQIYLSIVELVGQSGTAFAVPRG